jgi:hypothetical protein
MCSGDIAHAEELRQGVRIDGIGFHLGIGDGLEIFCMRQNWGDVLRGQEITQPVPIAGAFDDGLMGVGPLLEVVEHSLCFRFDFGSSNKSAVCVERAKRNRTAVEVDTSV